MLVTTLYLAISKHSVRTLVLFKSDLMLLSGRTLLLTIESSAPIRTYLNLFDNHGSFHDSYFSIDFWPDL